MRKSKLIKEFNELQARYNSLIKQLQAISFSKDNSTGYRFSIKVDSFQNKYIYIEYLVKTYDPLSGEETEELRNANLYIPENVISFIGICDNTKVLKEDNNSAIIRTIFKTEKECAEKFYLLLKNEGRIVDYLYFD